METHIKPAAPASDWGRVNAALDVRVELLGGAMKRYLSGDLSERLPRTQALFYRSGTTCDADQITIARRFGNPPPTGRAG